MANHRVDWQDEYPASCRQGAVAIGNFDGAHLGHAALIRELVLQARAVGGPAVALTFDPHPLVLLRPDVTVVMLTTPNDRAEYLHALGVNEVLTLQATPGLLELGARDFFELVLRRRLDVRAMVEGSNFGFGHNREGDVALLGELCDAAGMALRVVPPVLVEGEPVSSTRVRGELLHGDVAGAAILLGRPYRLRGVVGTGQRRGRTIGFPTANLERLATVIPGDGVYAVRARHAADETRPGAANIGPNPTFSEQERKVEVHLLDFTGDLYGQELAVEFVARLRDTRPFNSAADLVEQLRRDVERAREIVK